MAIEKAYTKITIYTPSGDILLDQEGSISGKEFELTSDAPDLTLEQIVKLGETLVKIGIELSGLI